MGDAQNCAETAQNYAESDLGPEFIGTLVPNSAKANPPPFMTGMHTGDENNDRLRLCAARRTKISSFDPALLTVRAAYPTPPFPPFPHPAIEGTSWRP